MQEKKREKTRARSLMRKGDPPRSTKKDAPPEEPDLNLESSDHRPEPAAEKRNARKIAHEKG